MKLIGWIACIFLLIVFVTQVMKQHIKRRLENRDAFHEELYLKIGGIRQYLNMRGMGEGKPVILQIHGGPGTPLTPLLHWYQIPLEGEFVLVHWDQRGAGKTFLANPTIRPEDVTVSSLLTDLDEVIDWLRKKFKTEKIWLLGHSFGTVITNSYSKRHPEKLLGLLHVSPMIHENEMSDLIRRELMHQSEKYKNRKVASKLAEITNYHIGFENFSLKSYRELQKLSFRYLHYQPLKNNLKGLFVKLTSPYYSWRELYQIYTKSYGHMEALLIYTYKDYNALLQDGEIPVNLGILVGERDWTTSKSLAKKYYNKVHAPKKVYFEIEDCGHSPMSSKPKELRKVMVETINLIIREGE